MCLVEKYSTPTYKGRKCQQDSDLGDYFQRQGDPELRVYRTLLAATMGQCPTAVAAVQNVMNLQPQ